MKVGAAHTAWDDPKYYAAEVAPPGWGHTKAEKEKTKPWKPKSKIGGSAAAFDRARKEGRFKGSKEDMFKLMWWMKNKGGKPKGKPHYKPGTDKKYKKYQEEWQKPNFVKDLPSQDEKRLEKHKEKRDVKKITKKVNEGRVAASYSGGTVTYSDWREKTKLVLKTIDFDNLVILGGSGVTGIGMINGFLDHDNFPMKRKVYIVTTSTISTVTNKLKQWESYYQNNITINDTPYDFYDEMDFYETPFPCNPNWDKKAWWWLENNIHKLNGETLFWNIGA